jgi:hypothetical protein
MIALKIIFFAIVSYFFWTLLVNFQKRKIMFISFLFWMGIWSISLIFVLWPNSSDYFAHSLGIGRGIDAAFFFSIVLLFALSFKLYFTIGKLDKTITELAKNTSQKFHEIDKH